MSDNNPGRGINSISSINKRPRLLSFQGPSESAIVEPPMAAGPSSSSLEEINVRQPALADLRPEMAPDLASWQEAQIAACIEDNTINLVLEQYLSFFEARHHGVEAEVVQAQEAAEMEREQEVLIEDRAILAAISERGLQPVEAYGVVVADDGDDDHPEMIQMGVAAGRLVDIDHHQQGIDLLESAVVAAIQEKGLTSAGNQFGQLEDDDGS